MDIIFIKKLSELFKVKDGDKIEITFSQDCRYKTLTGLFRVYVRANDIVYENCKVKYQINFTDLVFMIFHGLATVKFIGHTYSNAFAKDVYSKISDMLYTEFEDIDFEESDIHEMVDILLADNMIDDTINEVLYAGAYDYAEEIFKNMSK